MWAAITDVGAYRSWWPWLARFDGTAFAEGERWSCSVQPPLPYTLRFTVWLEAVEPCEFVDASIAGDIVGTARLTVRRVEDGTEVRLVSDLAPAHPFLRSVARFARPVVRFGHDWVLDTGATQFRRRAL